MIVKKIQKQLNLKFGFTLLVDGIAGRYTNLAIRLAKKEMGLSVNNTITKLFDATLAINKIWMPEAMESIGVWEDTKITKEKASKICDWLYKKNSKYGFGGWFILRLYQMGYIFNIAPTHALANFCIESAYGTSRIARRYKNLAGMGITDNPKNRTYYKYLTFGASAFDWYSLIEKYYIRGQTSEQKLNISARRHKAEWFNLDNIAGFQNYATSQTKSFVCGKLVREIREVMNEK